MEKKLRIIISSNGPWSSSGYAQQILDFAPLIRKEGYPLAVSAFYGLEGGVISLDDIVFYPKLGDTWGGDALVDHGRDFKADISFTLQDIWVLDPNHLRAAKRWIPILPVDHEPIPPPIADRCRLAYRIVSYSQFGYEELARNGFVSTYIPHTVDTTLFTKGDRNKLKASLGLPTDSFIFGMVSANKDNPSRKSFQEVMDAFKTFHDRHPKSGIYFHTILNQGGGFPIDQYARALGLQGCIYHIPPYKYMMKVAKGEMKNIYGAFDALLAPSTNEGFGVPIIEAQSCEVPVITNDFTAMRHLVVEGETGYKTRVGYKRFTPLLSYVGFPDVASILECMEKMYVADREKMGAAGRAFVVKNFDKMTVWETRWKPFLETLEREIYGEKT